MIEKWLIQNNGIRENERELYRYAVQSVILNITPILIAGFFGVLFRNVLQSILIVLPYMLIRKYSGGFHFKKARRCAIFSVCQIGIACGAVNYLEVHIGFMVFVVICAGSVILLSPVQNDAEVLDKDEIVLYKKIVATLVMIMLSLFFVCCRMNVKYAGSIGVGIFLAAFLVFLAFGEKNLKTMRIKYINSNREKM